MHHDRVKHILLSISCTEVDVPDDTRFSLIKTVLKIDRELRETDITLEQRFKNSQSNEAETINPEVVKVPDFISEHLRVRYFTTEQVKVLGSRRKLLIIMGPAGAGKTLLLSAKLLSKLNSSDRKVVVFTIVSGSKTFHDACKSVGVEFSVLEVDFETTTSDSLNEQIMRMLNDKRVGIIEMNVRKEISTVKGVYRTIRSIEKIKRAIYLLSNCDILIDDMQSVIYDGLPSFSKFLQMVTLKMLSGLNNSTVSVACDLGQYHHFVMNQYVTIILVVLSIFGPLIVTRVYASVMILIYSFLVFQV